MTRGGVGGGVDRDVCDVCDICDVGGDVCVGGGGGLMGLPFGATFDL
jgi:hypothetical protein